MEILKKKMEVYKKALISFKELLNIDIHKISENKVVIDGLENGQIQKFEYCSELTWKVIKKFLYTVDGVDVTSPKASIKEFYLQGYINDQEYHHLLQIVDDRNALSHLYSEEEFKAIHSSLPKHLSLMEKTFETINQKMSEKNVPNNTH